MGQGAGAVHGRRQRRGPSAAGRPGRAGRRSGPRPAAAAWGHLADGGRPGTPCRGARVARDAGRLLRDGGGCRGCARSSRPPCGHLRPVHGTSGSPLDSGREERRGMCASGTHLVTRQPRAHPLLRPVPSGGPTTWSAAAPRRAQQCGSRERRSAGRLLCRETGGQRYGPACRSRCSLGLHYSRFSSKMVQGAPRTINVKDAINVSTGAVTTPNAIPQGAKAISFTLTVTNTGNPGYVAVLPGTTTTVTASTINWSAPLATLATGGIVSLGTGPAERQVTLVVGGGGSCEHRRHRRHHRLLQVTGPGGLLRPIQACGPQQCVHCRCAPVTRGSWWRARRR